MFGGRRDGGSYEYITLRKENVKYVSEMTGKSVEELRHILEVQKARGKHSIKIPFGVNYFTREER